MAIEVLGIHHHATRIDAGGDGLAAVAAFYKDVLGLGADPGRPTIPGVPGFWINVGAGGQIHLIGGAQPSTLAKGPGQDPTIPHVALSVADIQAAKAELDRLGVKYWSMTGINGPEAEQIFVNDPSDNMVELHQVDQCRCAAEGRGE
jgi:catechol 2,3-dioxygenase-like lactoylglutathione lyase family enzyme